ncbi:PACN1 protein, partial [Polyodon spathula]|nr:PACN1 protein [Polyodon spathula]
MSVSRRDLSRLCCHVNRRGKKELVGAWRGDMGELMCFPKHLKAKLNFALLCPDGLACCLIPASDSFRKVGGVEVCTKTPEWPAGWSLYTPRATPGLWDVEAAECLPSALNQELQIVAPVEIGFKHIAERALLCSVYLISVPCFSAGRSELWCTHSQLPASASTSRIMSGSYDECAGFDEATDSFWENALKVPAWLTVKARVWGVQGESCSQGSTSSLPGCAKLPIIAGDSTGAVALALELPLEVGNYKRAVKRIDDGHRLCNDLMNCVHERAKIEKAYAQQLTDWSKRWKQLVEKGPQYGSLERAWMALMTEADKVSELHQEVKNGLLSEDFEKIKNWQKDSYHKQMMGGFKETKEAEDGFRKAQKPWAKKLKEVETAKKVYHLACKEEKLAAVREANSKAEASVTPDQQKKLQDKVDRCKQDVQKAKEKYEKALDELSKSTPQYIESMEQVFDPCQQFEEKRLSFLKEVLLDIKRHLNLTENQSYEAVYRELEQTVRIADAQEDLKWFNNYHGPAMPMNWPQFEEYNPDLTHTITKREKVKKPNEGVTLTSVTSGVEQVVQAGDRGSVSSYDRSQVFSAEWSDEDTPNTGSETNGGANPFEEETAAPAGKGVRVRALYDYDGQEQDELSFKAGDELLKLGEEDEQGWCKGRLGNGQDGLFPANYVESI